MKESIILDNGKYEVIVEQKENSFKLYALRYGEEWRDLLGDNLILSMFYKIQELEDRQIPKKIEIFDYGKAHCPICKTDIHGIGKIKHCFKCGQKLEW